MEYKIPNLRYIGLFSQSIVFKTEELKNNVVSIYIQLKLSQLSSMLIFYTPWKHQKTTYIFRGHNREY